MEEAIHLPSSLVSSSSLSVSYFFYFWFEIDFSINSVRLGFFIAPPPPPPRFMEGGGAVDFETLETFGLEFSFCGRVTATVGWEI